MIYWLKIDYLLFIVYVMETFEEYVNRRFNVLKLNYLDFASEQFETFREYCEEEYKISKALYERNAK